MPSPVARHRLLFAVILATGSPLVAASAALPDQPATTTRPPITQPVRDGDHLIFPEGAPIPRSLTKVERDFLADHPLENPGLRGPNPPPTGPIFCVPEYAPMEGILVAWESFTPLLGQMIQQITSNNAGTVFVVCDSAGEQASVATALGAATNPAVNLSLVKYIIRTTDTVWIRDYGPRYILNGTPGHQCRAISDHVYNRPRPNDDAFPPGFSVYKGHATYNLPLIHGGGNYHLDAGVGGGGRAYATRLISNENPGLNDAQIIGFWQSFQGVNTALLTPFPTNIDSTQHLDMWMQIISDSKVIISDWPSNPGSTQDVICDNQALAMAGLGYTVYRVPAYSLGGVHYTYANMVMCNNVVLLPSYTATPAGANAAALATLQTALPGKTIIPLNCDSIAPSAGVMHCIVMHVPTHQGVPGIGGQAPTTYLRTLRGGGAPLVPAAIAQVSFVSDDDKLPGAGGGVTTYDLLLSTDGGATFPNIVTQNTPIAAGGATTFLWTVPNRFVRNGRLRVVVRDGDGNSAFDQSDSDFRIAGSCTADWDGSGAVTPADLAAYVNSWTADLANGTTLANVDGDPAITPADVAAFVAAWFGAVSIGC